MLEKLVPAVLAALLTGCSANDMRFEAGVSSGYGIGERIVVPTAIHAGAELNETLGIDRKYGVVRTDIEFFSHKFISPETGYMVGVSPFLNYSYPLGDFSPYVELGAGPGYLDMKTREQGPPGFNFLDQGGCGVRYQVDDVSIRLGYRYSHISHAGLRIGPNTGIEAHQFLFGISIDF